MKRLLAVLAACSTAQSEPRKDADKKDPFADHITALRTSLAKKGYKKVAIRVESPFVAVGDAGDDALEQDSRTIRWACDHLEADFFDHRPSKILDVYLFRDADTYNAGVKALTGEDPTTPYGFYSAEHEGLFMNIGTGGGTLVHEIVHPYVEADFPGAPPWLNEGLGSLFEQSADKDGHIVGLTNWRLAGLQKALAKGHVPTFKALTHLGSNEFYGDDSGVNYAASRYLLYYLQQKDLLHGFYKAFRAARDKDPSGYGTLVATLGEKDMAAFEKRWAAYVMKLTFP
jgi:hypothetical protein